MLSVEAAYEANFGGEIEIDVYRNGELLGSAVVANVTDPIRVTREAPVDIERHQFDVIPLTAVGTLTVTETSTGRLRNNDEIWFHAQATQNGRPVTIPSGMLSLFLGEHTLNSESGMTIEPLLSNAGFPPISFDGDITSNAGFRVIRPSSGTPAVLSFGEIFVAGPTVPGLEWHVVVTGAERGYGNADNETTRNHGIVGISPNSFRFFPARINDNAGSHVQRGIFTGQYQNRARMYGLGYYGTILRVLGESQIDGGFADIGQLPPGGGMGNVQGGWSSTRMSFGEFTMADIDGHSIQAIVLEPVAPGVVSTMINPRVFADFIGGTVDWNAATSTATFTGNTMLGIPTTVQLTLNSTNVVVNGQSQDIAMLAGQPTLAGRIRPVVRDGRSYVPVRVLADIFGVPIGFEAGVITLG